MTEKAQDSRGMDSTSGPAQSDAAPVARDGRRSFLKSALAVASVPAAAAALSKSAGAATNPNYLPNLYRGWNARNFTDIMRHENDHVEFLVGALGDAARPKPNFRNLIQPDLQTFAAVSQALENTGVGAYLGALPLLVGTPFLQPAATIALIEARHAGYLNTLLNDPVTMNALGDEQSFETPLTPQKVVELASPFVQDLNGGPPLLQLNNAVDVLNFALALEYLEAEFYNVNVPKFL